MRQIHHPGLRRKAEQEDAMVRLEAHSQHIVSTKDTDSSVQVLKQELANHRQHALEELAQARHDAERTLVLREQHYGYSCA